MPQIFGNNLNEIAEVVRSHYSDLSIPDSRDRSRGSRIGTLVDGKMELSNQRMTTLSLDLALLPAVRAALPLYLFPRHQYWPVPVTRLRKNHSSNKVCDSHRLSRVPSKTPIITTNRYKCTIMHNDLGTNSFILGILNFHSS